MENGDEESRAKKILKYFAHGFLFSMLFTVLSIAGVFVMFSLILIGSIIGLIIGIIVLVIAAGFANSIIASFVWGFPVDMSIISLILHGLLLFAVLFVINFITIILPQTAFPGIATSIVTFITGSFLDGVAGKNIAGIWAGEKEETIEI